MSSGENIKPSLKLSRNFHCSACNLQFFIKDFTLKGSRWPLLLRCGHSICESCLQQMKSVNGVTCTQCGFISPMESTTGQDSDYFPLNIYLTGSLVVFQNYKYVRDRKLQFLMNNNGNFSYSVKGQTNLKVQANLPKCEECTIMATCYCESCKSNYCEVCWSKIHTSAKSLMKHVKRMISDADKRRIGLKKCPVHESEDLEFCCKSCCTYVCPHCIIQEHQGEGHCLVTLKEKNLEMIDQIKAVANEAKIMSRRMKHTLEKLKRTMSSSELSDNQIYLDLEKQVMRNFARLHGILQLEEERCLMQLHKKAKERESSLSAFRIQLESYTENIDSLLYESENISDLTCDLTNLHKMLSDVKKLPCYLVSRKSEQGEAKITFDDTLFDSLRNVCTLELPPDETFELCSAEDLPESYEIDPLDDDDFAQGNEQLWKTEEKSHTLEASTKVAKDVHSPVKPTKSPNIFHEGRNYSVRLSYIKNPGEFYVTLNSQRSILQQIDKKSRHFATVFPAFPKNLKKDDVYLVQYGVDKNWYRARAVEVLPRDGSRQEGALVYYLDYGNTECVPVSRIRLAPQELLTDEPLAIKCQLFDCVPKNKNWCPESTKIMEKILENSNVTMFVIKIRPDCLEVDLSQICSEGLIGKDIISVRDALIFLDFAHLVPGFKKMENPTALRYLDQHFPSGGESFEAVITHVNSPSDFYVQRTSQDIPFAYRLSVDMQNYYNDNSHKGVIYNPLVGMPCAAIFSGDKKWYRAEIIEIPGKKMLTVFYVDYGNTETISWTMVRKLRECFVKRPPLALNCSLAGIKPNSTHWNVHAKSYLEKSIQEKDFRICVQGRVKSNQKLKVLLYRRIASKEMCVNLLFVDMGFAVSSSPGSAWIKSEKREISEYSCSDSQHPEYTEFEMDAAEAGSNFHQNIKSFERKKKNKLNAKELREIHSSEKRIYTEVLNSDEETTSTVEVQGLENSFKAKIYVLSAESPSSIYVVFSGLSEVLSQLRSKMNDFYDNTDAEEGKDWEVDNKCAVYCSEKTCWYRGLILSFLPDNRAKVFLIDVAAVSTVPVSSLRDLDPSFSKYPTCAVKCHLSDIAPAGDQWPSVSCEFLSGQLENCDEVYMTKKGEIEDKSLPVELWVQKVTLRGALEPTTKEWVTLNRLLVDQGLAIPVEVSKLCSPVSRDGGFSPDDTKCPEVEKNSSESCAEEEESREVGRISSAFIPSLNSSWLPPEPLKKTLFIGRPTYVDLDACIYIYDAEDESKLKAIQESLLEEYENSKPSVEDHFWSQKQLCVARYHVDACWYRGLVLKTNEDLTYDVLFVDYGNVETCQASDLRKRIKMMDIPILTHKFRLQGVVSVSEDGKWPISVIEILHSIVVDKICEVKVINQSLDPNEPPVISLKLIEGEVDVASFLLMQGFSQPQSDPDTLNEKCSEHSSDSSDTESTLDMSFESPEKVLESDDNLHFVPLNIPKNCKEFFMKVTAVKSQNEIFVNIIDDQILSPSLRQILKDFEHLKEELEKDGSSLPHLKRFGINQPCCFVDPVTGKWFRGQIHDTTEIANTVCVVYVDCGLRKFLTKNSLHECKRAWLSVPKMAVKCRLTNIKKCQNVTKPVYQKAVTDCLHEASYFAEILKKHGKFLEVKLLTKKDGTPVFQELVDQGLLQFV